MALNVPNTPWLPLWAWAWVLAAVLAMLYMNLRRKGNIWNRKSGYQGPLSVLTVLTSLAALAITASAVTTIGNAKKRQTTSASPAKLKPQKPPATIPATTTTTTPKVVISPPHQSRAKRPVNHRKAKQHKAAKPKIKKQVNKVHRTTAPAYHPPASQPVVSPVVTHVVLPPVYRPAPVKPHHKRLVLPTVPPSPSP